MDEARLLLVFETTMFSVIQAMAVVRLPGQSADSLILSFADAKVSVLAWESDKSNVGIVSLHYFEKDAGVSVRDASFLPPIFYRELTLKIGRCHSIRSRSTSDRRLPESLRLRFNLR